jgi:ubiquinone/menaquinone biosynthesis C-methylase UbiE
LEIRPTLGEKVVLPRTPEPEVMDTAREARDYDAMDHAAVNRVFVADFLAAWQATGGPAGGEVLDLGTGTAQIPVELCRCHPLVRVRAIDLSEHMLEVARQNVRGAGLGERIGLERCDAKALPFPDGRFPAVMSNSIVHHAPDPGRVLAEAVRVAGPGALLFLRDLSRPSDEPTLARLVDRYAAGANAHQRQMYADSLRAALTLDEMRSLVGALGFDPAGVRQTTDRHWTWQQKMTR